MNEQFTKGPKMIEAAAPDLFLALQAQQVCSDMQKEREMPQPNDPRYVPFIGEWNGYQSPEVRWIEFVNRRRELRVAALSKASGGGE